MIGQSYAFFITYINTSELLNAETLCAHNYSCARLYICARGVQRSSENLTIFSLVSRKLVRKIFFSCWRIWSFWAAILSSLMPKYVFINTTRQIFYWKDEASQISVRIRCMVSCVPRVLNGSAGAAPLILVMFFGSAPSISDHSVSQACIECEQIFEMPHLSNKTFVLYWYWKKNVIIHFQKLWNETSSNSISEKKA